MQILKILSMRITKLLDYKVAYFLSFINLSKFIRQISKSK